MPAIDLFLDRQRLLTRRCTYWMRENWRWKLTCLEEPLLEELTSNNLDTSLWYAIAIGKVFSSQGLILERCSHRSTTIISAKGWHIFTNIINKWNHWIERYHVISSTSHSYYGSYKCFIALWWWWWFMLVFSSSLRNKDAVFLAILRSHH